MDRALINVHALAGKLVPVESNAQALVSVINEWAPIVAIVDVTTACRGVMISRISPALGLVRVLLTGLLVGSAIRVSRVSSAVDGLWLWLAAGVVRVVVAVAVTFIVFVTQAFLSFGIS